MNLKELKNELLQHTKSSVDFFSSENKKPREIWVVDQFLKNLGVKFHKDEIIPNTDDPPDVKYCGASFEIKELSDEGRQRHREYKDYAKRLEKVEELSELTEPVHPMSATLQEVVTMIESNLASYLIDPALCPRIDILYYVNLQDLYFLKNSEYSFNNKHIWQKWRSVSLVENGKISVVLWATKDAPDFIKANLRIFHRRPAID